MAGFPNSCCRLMIREQSPEGRSRDVLFVVDWVTVSRIVPNWRKRREGNRPPTRNTLVVATKGLFAVSGYTCVFIYDWPVLYLISMHDYHRLI